MEVSAEILKEADVLLAAFVMGALLLFAYDMLRIVRRIVPHKIWLVGMEDIIFWIGSGIALFAMLYQENSGYIRGFVIGGVLIGMLLYNLALSTWVVAGSVFLLKKILFVLSRPLVWTARLLKKPMGFVGRKAKKFLRFYKKELKKLWKTVKMGICKL